MKKFFMMLCSLFIALTVTKADGRVTHDVSLLPTAAREFIRQQFPKTTISYLSIDKNLLGTSGYDVRLDDGTEIDFDNKGEWVEIDCEPQAVPHSAIPVKVKEYIQKHYPKNLVTKIKHSRKGYELELNNDLEIDFDQQGNFIRMDD